jgi:hypothetical protein
MFEEEWPHVRKVILKINTNYNIAALKLQYCSFTSTPNIMVEWLTILLCIQEVPVSNHLHSDSLS